MLPVLEQGKENGEGFVLLLQFLFGHINCVGLLAEKEKDQM
jgi:hypothetical protein